MKEKLRRKCDILRATEQGRETYKIDRMRAIGTEREKRRNSAGLRMSVEQRDVWVQCTAEYCNTCNY